MFAESELWPNLLLGARERGARTALVSARLSAGSVRGWARAPAAALTVLGGFDLLLAQDDEAAASLVRLGGRDDGRLNLKLAGAPLPADLDALDLVRRQLGRPPAAARRLHPSRRGGAGSGGVRLAEDPARAPAAGDRPAPPCPGRGRGGPGSWPGLHRRPAGSGRTADGRDGGLCRRYPGRAWPVAAAGAAGGGGRLAGDGRGRSQPAGGRPARLPRRRRASCGELAWGVRGPDGRARGTAGRGVRPVWRGCWPRRWATRRDLRAEAARASAFAAREAGAVGAAAIRLLALLPP